MSNYLFTSEAVTEGHPDKVCDRISDAVLDAVMEKDPNGRVACETCCTTGMVLVMGEMSTKAYIDCHHDGAGVAVEAATPAPSWWQSTSSPRILRWGRTMRWGEPEIRA